jgi:DNA-binding PadR family transcriptional regulator
MITEKELGLFHRHSHHEHGRHGGGHDGGRGHFAIFGEMGRGGPGRFGARHFGGREGGGRRRVFDSGELRLVLLKLIEEQPRHGYDLIREIEERTGGAYAPSPGVIYPTLTLLDDMGLIAQAVSEGAKKQFAITETGAAELLAKADEVAALFQRLAELGVAREKTNGTTIRRATGNLRAVLANRLSADDVTPETLHQVAALLDEVAQKIERL